MPTSPPVKRVRTLSIPFKVLVMRNDPDFETAKRKETFYQFSNGRRFDANPTKQGAYSDAPSDNP